MKAKESLKIWFDQLSQMGESSNILISVKNKNEIKEYEFSHGEFDAISGFIKNIGDFEGLNTNLSLRKKEKSKLKYLIGFLRYSLRIPFYSAKWNKYIVGWRDINSKYYPQSVFYFSNEDTQKIIENAKARQVSLNSYLMYYLDKSIINLLNSNQKRVWLIPVNVRSDIRNVSSGNEVGFIDAVITQYDSMASIHQQVQKRIKCYEHLGGIVGVSLGVIIGEFLLRKLVWLNKYLQVRTGVFTNLGEWTAPGKEDLQICGFPPVLETQPIGAGALTWCGRMTIAIHSHPCLGFSSSELEAIMQSWVKLIKENK